MRTTALNYNPKFTEEEIDSLINEYTKCKIVVCESCEEINPDIEYELTDKGDYYTRPEYKELCACCGAEYSVIKPDFEWWIEIN